MHHLHTVFIVGSSPTASTKLLLGYSLVWPKATVFEIVITGSNPVTSARFIKFLYIYKIFFNVIPV